MNLIGVRYQLPQIRFQFGNHLDVFPDQAVQDPLDVFHDNVQIHRPRAERLFPAQSQ